MMATPASAPPRRPVPTPDAASAPFFEALRERRLVVQRCRSCAAFQLGELQCNRCGADALEWQPASGRAVLHSYTVIHQGYHPAFAALLPYNAAEVELEEGPRLFSNVVGCRNDELRIGEPLEASFEQDGDNVLLAFRLHQGTTLPR